MVFIIHDRSTKTRNEISSLKLRKNYYWASPALLHIWLGNYRENLFELDTSSFMSPPDFCGGSKYLGAEAATGESRGDRVVTK